MSLRRWAAFLFIGAAFSSVARAVTRVNYSQAKNLYLFDPRLWKKEGIVIPKGSSCNNQSPLRAQLHSSRTDDTGFNVSSFEMRVDATQPAANDQSRHLFPFEVCTLVDSRRGIRTCVADPSKASATAPKPIGLQAPILRLNVTASLNDCKGCELIQLGSNSIELVEASFWHGQVCVAPTPCQLYRALKALKANSTAGVNIGVSVDLSHAATDANIKFDTVVREVPFMRKEVPPHSMQTAAAAATSRAAGDDDEENSFQLDGHDAAHFTQVVETVYERHDMASFPSCSAPLDEDGIANPKGTRFTLFLSKSGQRCFNAKGCAIKPKCKKGAQQCPSLEWAVPPQTAPTT